MTEHFDPLQVKRALRERQWRVLVAVEQIGRDGWPVTVRETAAAAGFSSLQTAHATLGELVLLELLESNPRFRGGWRISERGRLVTGA